MDVRGLGWSGTRTDRAEPGTGWQHFRGPDGNVYELVALTRPSGVAGADPGAG